MFGELWKRVRGLAEAAPELRRSRSGGAASARGAPAPPLGGGEAAAPAPVPAAPTESTDQDPVSLEATAARIREATGGRQGRGRRLVKPADQTRTVFTAEQRILILDTWRRSGLSARDFAALVGVSKHTLYKWKSRFEREGPSGLMDQPKGRPKGSRLPDLTKRSIVMLKEAHPDYGCQRISDLLARGPALGASPSAVARVLHEAGYVLKETPTRPHREQVRRFERAKPNELWQTDIFTFMLKRQNRRVHLVAFMDDHSRFVVGFGLHATASSALVLETFRSAIASYQAPKEVLTDNGSQYVTWRGKSAFRKACEQRGIAHLVATPRRPQTLGKIERFWGTMWRDCIETAIFLDLEDARKRIGLFLDHYNFQRPHQGIEGLVPADRFFGAAPEVLATMKARIEANALQMARNGLPKRPFYLTGQLGDKAFSLHGEGDRIILRESDGRREEVALVMDERAETSEPPEGSEPGESAPGVSPLDEGLEAVAEALEPPESEEPS